MFYFFSYFYSKTSWTIQKWGNFYNLFFLSSDLGFFAVFGWYFTPWIWIRGSAYFCGSGSRKPKSCVLDRIRLLCYSGERWLQLWTFCKINSEEEHLYCVCKRKFLILLSTISTTVDNQNINKQIFISSRRNIYSFNILNQKSFPKTRLKLSLNSHVYWDTLYKNNINLTHSY